MNPDPVIMIPTLEQLEQGGFATIRTTLTCTGCNHIINSPVVVRDALHCIEQLFHANKIRLQGNAPEIWMKPNSNKCPNCMRNYMKPSIPNDITYIDWLSLFCLKPIRPCNREQLELFRRKGRLPSRVSKARLVYQVYRHIAIQRHS